MSWDPSIRSRDTSSPSSYSCSSTSNSSQGTLDSSQSLTSCILRPSFRLFPLYRASLSLEQKYRRLEILNKPIRLVSPKDRLQLDLPIAEFCTIFGAEARKFGIHFAWEDPFFIGTAAGYIVSGEKYADIDFNYYLTNVKDLENIPALVQKTIENIFQGSFWEGSRTPLHENSKEHHYFTCLGQSETPHDYWSLLAFETIDFRFIVSKERPYISVADSIFVSSSSDYFGCLNGFSWGDQAALQRALVHQRQKIFDVDDPHKIHAFPCILLKRLTRGYFCSPDLFWHAACNISDNSSDYFFFSRFVKKQSTFASEEEKFFYFLNLCQTLEASLPEGSDRLGIYKILKGLWPNQSLSEKLAHKFLDDPSCTKAFVDSIFSYFLFAFLEGDSRIDFYPKKFGVKDRSMSIALDKHKIFLRLDKMPCTLVEESIKRIEDEKDCDEKSFKAQISDQFCSLFGLGIPNLNDYLARIMAKIHSPSFKEFPLAPPVREQYPSILNEEGERREILNFISKSFPEHIPWESFFQSSDEKKKGLAIAYFPNAFQKMPSQELFSKYLLCLAKEGFLEAKKNDIGKIEGSQAYLKATIEALDKPEEQNLKLFEIFVRYFADTALELYETLLEPTESMPSYEGNVFYFLRFLQSLQSLSLTDVQRSSFLQTISDRQVYKGFGEQSLEFLCVHPSHFSLLGDYMQARFFFAYLFGDDRFEFYRRDHSECDFYMFFQNAGQRHALVLKKSPSDLLRNSLKAVDFFQNFEGRKPLFELDQFFSALKLQDLKLSAVFEHLLVLMELPRLNDLFKAPFSKEEEKKAIYQTIANSYPQYFPWKQYFASSVLKKRRLALYFYPQAFQKDPNEELLSSYLLLLLRENLFFKKRSDLNELLEGKAAFEDYKSAIDDSQKSLTLLLKIFLRKFDERALEIFSSFLDERDPSFDKIDRKIHRHYAFDWIAKNAKARNQEALVLFEKTKYDYRNVAPTEISTLKRIIAQASLFAFAGENAIQVDQKIGFLKDWEIYLENQSQYNEEQSEEKLNQLKRSSDLLFVFRGLNLPHRVFWQACLSGFFKPPALSTLLPQFLEDCDYAHLERAIVLWPTSRDLLIQRYFSLLEDSTYLEASQVLGIYSALQESLSEEQKLKLHDLFIQKLKKGQYASYIEIERSKLQVSQKHTEALLKRKNPEEVQTLFDLLTTNASKESLLELLHLSWLPHNDLYDFFRRLSRSGDAYQEEVAFEALLELTKRASPKERRAKRTFLCTLWKNKYSNEIFRSFFDLFLEEKETRSFQESLDLCLGYAENLRDDQAKPYIDDLFNFLLFGSKVEKNSSVYAKAYRFLCKEKEQLFKDDKQLEMALDLLKYLDKASSKTLKELQKNFLLLFFHSSKDQRFLDEIILLWSQRDDFLERISSLKDRLDKDQYFELFFKSLPCFFSIWKESNQPYNANLLQAIQEQLPHCPANHAFSLYTILSKQIEKASRIEIKKILELIEALEDRHSIWHESKAASQKKRKLDDKTLGRIISADSTLCQLSAVAISRFELYHKNLPWRDDLKEEFFLPRFKTVELQSAALLAMTYGHPETFEKVLHESLRYAKSIDCFEVQQLYLKEYVYPYIYYSSLLPFFFGEIFNGVLDLMREDIKNNSTEKGDKESIIHNAKVFSQFNGKLVLNIFKNAGFESFAAVLKADTSQKTYTIGHYGYYVLLMSKNSRGEIAIRNLIRGHDLVQKDQNKQFIKDLWMHRDLAKPSQWGICSEEFARFEREMRKFLKNQ